MQRGLVYQYSVGITKGPQARERLEPMRRLILPALLIVAGASFCAGKVMADGISGSLMLTNCGGGSSACPGATYNFTANNTTATLTIKIGGVPGGNALTSSNDTLTGVDLGLLPQHDVSSLTSNVAVTQNGLPDTTWTGSLTSLNNGNCSGNGGAFVCASGSPITLTSGDTYVFTWNYTLTSQGQTDLLNDTSVHIGANYGPANGLIVSQLAGVAAPPSAAPEPSSLMLLGAGMLGMALLLGRKAAK